MDYTRLAILESINDLKRETEADIEQMAIESQFLQDCYESNYIVVNEAKKADLMHGLIVGGQKFFDKISAMFRASAIKKYKKQYNANTCKLIRQNMDTVKANCMKLDSQKTTPLWKGKWSQDENMLKSAMTQAFNNVTNGKFDDYSYGKTFINDVTMIKDQDTEMVGYLKNYFRYNDNNMSTPESATVTGKDLAGKIDEILKYIEAYPGTIAAIPGKISDDFKQRSKSVKVYNPDTGEKENVGNVTANELKDDANGTKPATPAKETYEFTADTFLMVEGKYVSETNLPFLMGYESLLEAKGKNNANSAGGSSSSSGGDQPSNTETKDDVKVTGGIQDADPNAAKKEEATGDAASTDKKEDDKADKDAGKEYLNDAVHFFKVATSAYTTALEERFVSYSKILDVVAKEYMKSPEKKAEDGEKAEAEDKTKEKKGIFKRKKK